MLTIEELKERLVEEFDEVSLLELLGLEAKDLVEAFHDKIEERFEKLREEIEEEDIAD